MIFTNKHTFYELEKMAEKATRLVYSAQTCWWKIGDPVYSTADSLPCDPLGGVLMETDDLMAFIKAAKDNPDFYGKYGLRTFASAHEGNMVALDGKSTCHPSWDIYNRALDMYDAKWSLYVLDDYKELGNREGWEKCPVCNEYPRVWLFDNGRFAKCCCGDKLQGSHVGAESINSWVKRHEGSAANFPDDELRTNWNNWVLNKITSVYLNNK